VTEVKKAGQMELNVDFYSAIFVKCLDAAEKIGNDRTYSRDETFKIAETIFKQFFVDQTALAGQERQTKAIMDGMHSVLEARGR
jgi:hypothetical protein